MLAEMGMTAPEFSTFITRYTQRLEKLREFDARHADVEKIGRAEGSSKAPTILRGSTDAHGASSTAPSQVEALSGLAAPPRQNVSEEYRQHVEDYLRAVAETRPSK